MSFLIHADEVLLNLKLKKVKFGFTEFTSSYPVIWRNATY